MQRQGATPKGLERRLRDLGFDKVGDPRVASKVAHPLPRLLTALVAAMTSGAGSLRKVEERTGQMAKRHGEWMGLGGRIADNTFGEVLPRLALHDLMDALHRLVKAEQRRGNLEPRVLPVGTVAIDGKNVATLRWHDLCRVLDLEPEEANHEQVKALLAERFPAVQFCVSSQAEPYALARAHTVTLVSSEAAVCLHQRPILGCTNEVGSMAELLDELHAAYGRSRLIGMVTTDAGNTSLKVATEIRDRHHWHYFLQIKSEHGDLYTEAVRALESKTARQALSTLSDYQNGKVVTYRVWCHDLTEQGWLNWIHGRQLVRVQRTVEVEATGDKTVGNRFYVCSQSPADLGPKGCLRVSRAHWRCENETHWTADTLLGEDRRRLAWSRHPHGVFVVAALRMIALAILALARKLSRQGHSLETPSWKQVAEHFFLVLCGSVLHMEAFDADTK